MRKALLILLFLAGSASAQERVKLHQALLDLQYPFTVMCVAAHPDDEDSDGLAYFRMKYGARTVLVTATRGEGGQNSSGPELYEELAAVRMQELARAAERLDTLTFNLAMPEFGFSKSAEETFQYWDKREALRRLVYAIRLYRPDVVITTHNASTGHGHHRATRLLTEEAIDMAADRLAFADQLSSGLKLWTVKRMFERVFSGNKFDVEFDSNLTEPARGLSYAQIGFESRLEHRSQGPWGTLPKTFERMCRYILVKKQPGDQFRKWYRIDQNLELPSVYDRIVPDAQTFSTLDKSALLSRLKTALNSIRAYMKAEGREDLYAPILEAKLINALRLCAGISFSITQEKTSVVQGQSFAFKAMLEHAESGKVELVDVRVSYPEDWQLQEPQLPVQLEPKMVLDYSLRIAALTPPTLPQSLSSLDYQQPQVWAEAILRLEGLEEPLKVATGMRIEVEPAIVLELQRDELFINLQDVVRLPTIPLQVKVTNRSSSMFRGRLSFGQHQFLTSTPELVSFQLPAGASSTLTTLMLPRSLYNESQGLALRIPVTLKDEAGREVAVQVLRVNLVRMAVPKVRVGYLRTYDYTLPVALKHLGLQATALQVDDLKRDLTLYDTLILDNRAYLAYPELSEVTKQLKEFVRAGGTLLVFYQRPADWNSAFAPYPIKLGNRRVTDENAPVTFLVPEHPVVSRPNRITTEDFEGWVQERGLSFPETWDEAYKAIFAMADKGEDPLTGGLLVADYGKGRYIYTSLAIYRQLRAGHIGAYKLFCNLLAK